MDYPIGVLPQGFLLKGLDDVEHVYGEGGTVIL